MYFYNFFPLTFSYIFIIYTTYNNFIFLNKGLRFHGRYVLIYNINQKHNTYFSNAYKIQRMKQTFMLVANLYDQI